MGVSVYSNRGMRSFTEDVVRCGVSNHEEATKGAILITMGHIIGNPALPS